jgi:hypothetical protein
MDDLVWDDYFDNDREAGGDVEIDETDEEEIARAVSVKAYMDSL